MKLDQWIQHFLELGLVFATDKADERRVLLDAFLKNDIPEDLFTRWAQEQLEVPLLKDEFFTQFAPSTEFWLQCQGVLEWDQGFLPLLLWDEQFITVGHLPPQVSPQDPPFIFLIATKKQMQSLWSFYQTQSTIEVAAPKIPSMNQVEAAGLPPASTTSFQPIELSDTPAADEKENAESSEEELMEPTIADGEPLAPEGFFSNAPSAAGSVLAPSAPVSSQSTSVAVTLQSPSVSSSESAPLTPKSSILQKASETSPLVETPSTPDGQTQDALALDPLMPPPPPPSEIPFAVLDEPQPLKPAVIPAAKVVAQPVVQPAAKLDSLPKASLAVSAQAPSTSPEKTKHHELIKHITLQEVETAMNQYFASLENQFDKSFFGFINPQSQQLQIALTKNAGSPSQWVDPAPLAIAEPSSCTIAVRTQKSFYGNPVVNETNKKIFELINDGAVPENLTIIPLIRADRVLAVVGFINKKEAYSLEQLAFFENELRSFFTMDQGLSVTDMAKAS